MQQPAGELCGPQRPRSEGHQHLPAGTGADEAEDAGYRVIRAAEVSPVARWAPVILPVDIQKFPDKYITVVLDNLNDNAGTLDLAARRRREKSSGAGVSRPAPEPDEREVQPKGIAIRPIRPLHFRADMSYWVLRVTRSPR